MDNRTSGHQLAMSLRAAYWAMHRRADAVFSRLGVTADQFVLLSSLAEGDGITQQELVRRAASDPNTVRAMLVRLERRGLVARRPHRNDGRAHSVTLTPMGRRIQRRLAARSEPLRARLLAGLEEYEVSTLMDLLARVAQSMTKKDKTRSKR